MSFVERLAGDVALWRGKPDCDAAHLFLRNWLRENVSNYPTQWIKGDTRTQGNLGETIAFCVGNLHRFSELKCFQANALAPFSGISRSDVDLLWLGFGDDPANDFAILQEVKTTFGMSLSYADKVLEDYDKAFGENPRFTLNSRLLAVKGMLRFQHFREDLSKRVNALMGTSPKTASRITAVPTLVHDLASADPVEKMTAIRETLLGKGWRKVDPWSIGFSDLESRMERITQDAA